MWYLVQNIQSLSSKVKMPPRNKMKTRSQNTYHIVRRVGKQGMSSPRESNQPGVEKCTTGSATSLEKLSDGNHAQEDLPPFSFQRKRKNTKIKMEQGGL